MDSIKKDGKLPYEPPKIYELDVDMIQAMGASTCHPGASAAGYECKAGSSPASSCTNGSSATGVTCKKGTSNIGSCRTGSSPK
jgi:hypothetical protein